MGELDDWKSILFVEERFHTNQHPIVKTLREKGHDIHFLASRKQQSEEYSELQPDFVRYSILFRLLYAVLRDVQTEGQFYKTSDKFVHKYGLPKLRWYNQYLSETDPDLIVLKGYNVITFLTILYAKIRDIDLLFYDQDPVYGYEEKSTSRTIARGLQSGLCRERFVRFSPVQGNETETKARPHTYYLPFVAEPHPAGDTRDYAPDGTIRFVIVGKFTSPRKNHIPLIEAVERLADTHDVQLTLIGELEEPDHDYFARIQRTIADSDIRDAIDVRTNLRYDAVQQAYLEHDIYVLPSARERAAVSHLEAMAHGLPVICSATNGTSCYVNPGENGYLITPGDREELRAQIERLLVNNRLSVFGKNSYELVETTYSGEQFYERLGTILQENF